MERARQTARQCKCAAVCWTREEQARDEDGYSRKEECVWNENEAEENESSGEAPSDDDLDALADAVRARRSHRRSQGLGGVVAEYDALAAAEKTRRRSKK